MKKLIGLVVLLSFTLVFSSSLLAAEKQKKGPSYGDWGYACEKNPQGGKDICHIYQNLTSKENGKFLLKAQVGRIPNNKDPVLIVQVTLGTLLPPGVAFFTKGVDPLKLAYLTCVPAGCLTAAVAIPKNVVAAMKKGTEASVRVVGMNRKVLSLPISLKGFTKGMAALDAKK